MQEPDDPWITKLENARLTIRRNPDAQYSILTHVWANTMQRQLDLQYGITARMREQRDAELKWVRESMERDLLPDWLIEMVCEQWG